MIGILPYAGVDIAVFEILKEKLLDRYDGHPPASTILGIGMFSSSIAQVGGCEVEAPAGQAGLR